MRVLVGLPAFRLHDLLRGCLNSLINTPATILVVDNGADANIKALLRDEFAGKISIIVNQENMHCNRAWNQILHCGLSDGYDIIGLGTDAALPPFWYETILARIAKYPNEVLVPNLYTGEVLQGKPDIENVEHAVGGVMGFFSFLPRKAAEIVYPIPNTLKHWFGDQYMFETLKDAGWKITIMKDLLAYHQLSVVGAANPEINSIIESDKKEWQKLQEAK